MLTKASALPADVELAVRLAGASRAGVNALDVLAANTTGTPSTTTVADPSGGRYQPVLRKMVEGETRVVGIFTSVECNAGVILSSIDVGGLVMRMRTTTLAEVEFLTYRQEPPGSVGCGSQPTGNRVAATYRPGAGNAADGVVGQAVAIELLPDGYTPR